MIKDRFQVLVTTAEERSITAAADKLGYTPSGISRMIATLEREAGVKLFVRSKNGVAPTDACIQLLPTARSILYYAEQYDQIASEISGLTKGTLTIGTSYSSYYSWLTQVIAEFNKIYPGIEVKIVQKNSTLLTEAVINHETDLGIVSKRDGAFDWITLLRDPMTAWVPKDSKYVKMGHMPIEDFTEVDFIMPYPNEDTDTKRVLDEFGIKPHVKYTVNDTNAAVCLVEAGLGITLENNLDWDNWDHRIGIVPIKPDYYFEIGLISAKREELSPAARRFIEFIKEKI